MKECQWYTNWVKNINLYKSVQSMTLVLFSSISKIKKTYKHTHAGKKGLE